MVRPSPIAAEPTPAFAAPPNLLTPRPAKAPTAIDGNDSTAALAIRDGLLRATPSFAPTPSAS